MRSSPKVVAFKNDNAKTHTIFMGNGGFYEHAEGIGRLKSALSIPSPKFPMGLRDRMIQDHDSILERGVVVWRESKIQLRVVSQADRYKINIGRPSYVKAPVAILSVGSYLRDEDPENKFKKWNRKIQTCEIEDGEHSQALRGSWGIEGFEIGAIGGDAVASLASLHEGFQQGDIAVFTGGGHTFRGQGLTVTRPSLAPIDVQTEMLNQDIEGKRLTEAVERTGIVERIETAQGPWKTGGYYNYQKKYGYYALKPDWLMEDIVGKSDHPVMFFLNPMDQQNVPYGWYRVEDLDRWISGHSLENPNRRELERRNAADNTNAPALSDEETPSMRGP